jgi:hypothetical protein
MAATVHPSVVSQLLQRLPTRLLGALDAWSHRIARRRAEERQRKWLASKAGPALAQPADYRLKPWRD